MLACFMATLWAEMRWLEWEVDIGIRPCGSMRKREQENHSSSITKTGKKGRANPTLIFFGVDKVGLLHMHCGIGREISSS